MRLNIDFNNNFFHFYQKFLTSERSEKEVKFLQKFIKSQNSKILDFGCGWGRHLKGFAEIGYKNLTGIDSARKLLGRAKNNLKKYPFIKLVEYDFAGFKSSEKYDFIFQVFQSFGYDTKAYDQKNLENVNKLLSSEGVYFLDLRNPIKLLKLEDSDRPSFIKIQVDRKKKRFRYLYDLDGIKDYSECNIYTIEELKKMFKKAGFKIIKTFGDFRGNKYSDQSERLIIVAKKA